MKHPVISHEEWLPARRELPLKEGSSRACASS
jgi:hypothetical protein